MKLLALDLDGTILTTDKQVTPRTREALTAAIRSGVEVVLVTGRPYLGLPDELLQIPGIRYAITSNGAVSTDLSNGQNLRASLLLPDIVQEIVKIPRKRDLIYNVFIDGAGYSEPHIYQRQLQRFIGTPIEDYVRKSRRFAEDMPALIGSAFHGIENIWIMGRDQAERDQIHESIQERWNLTTVLTAPTDIEIGAPGSDKGLALTELAEMLRIRKPDILAIGDGENDLGMLHAAGTAVAMGNASDKVKDQSDYITDSNDRDGAAIAIEQFCLGGIA